MPTCSSLLAMTNGVRSKLPEEEEEINVVDLSDTEDCARSGSSSTSAACQHPALNPGGENSPLDLSYKSQGASSAKISGVTDKAVFSRPSVIKSSDAKFDSEELPDVEEHFRKSLGPNPKVFTEAEAKGLEEATPQRFNPGTLRQSAMCWEEVTANGDTVLNGVRGHCSCDFRVFLGI
ncbi:unnamed protein product [Soboliphyme baturini]|uniref:CDCA2 n=1 Tax=Soboliphyme baturini TaxID=241478 RepID=A0A183IVG5_9BILA|nr:unnamed protein product [Soboliphyme baturini]